MIWEIWKERNRRIFKDRKLTFEQLISKIEVVIIEIINSRVLSNPKKDTSLSHWDDKMHGKWVGLKLPSFVGLGSHNTTNKRREYKWQPPKEGWFKLNFNGASRGNSGAASIGCIIHDSEERVVQEHLTQGGLHEAFKFIFV